MWSVQERLEDCLRALKEVEDIADSAGDPMEQILEIRAVVKEVLE